MKSLQETLIQDIRQLRKKRGMDQATLARIVGLSRTSITNIESNRQAISLQVFCDITAALGKDPGTFLNEALQKTAVDKFNLSATDITAAVLSKIESSTSSKGGHND